jgi:hypothetical protein
MAYSLAPKKLLHQSIQIFLIIGDLTNSEFQSIRVTESFAASIGVSLLAARSPFSNSGDGNTCAL